MPSDKLRKFVSVMRAGGTADVPSADELEQVYKDVRKIESQLTKMKRLIDQLRQGENEE